MKYLLTGGEFNNKGAEAMTLIALSNIYNADDNAEVYMVDMPYRCPYELKKSINYLLVPVWICDFMLGKITGLGIRSFFKEVIKLVVPGKPSSIFKVGQIKNTLCSIDVMIDISGFALSSKFPEARSTIWLDMIRILKKNGAKVYIMPQSFGPFEYKSKRIVDYAKKTLPLCDKLYVREKSGYDLLKKLGIENAELSADSVLIENKYDPSDVIVDPAQYYVEIENLAAHNLAIIPNYRLVDHAGMDSDKIIELYKCFIDANKADNNIYLMAHAREDLKMCKLIKEHYKDEENIILIVKIMSSFSFERIMGKMDYIFASRYHSLIHAYRQGTPAIILGWADKYKDLAARFSQEQYIVNLHDKERFNQAVDLMKSNYQKEHEHISGIITGVQTSSCYAFLEKEE